MIEFKITYTNPIEIPEGSASGRINAAMTKFRQDAGDLIVKTIQDFLGDETALGFSLKPEYAERKQKDKRLRRVAGKSADQPLILSREGIYDAFEIVANSDGLSVKLKEGAGRSDKGYDYAQMWVEHVRLMDEVLLRIDDQLPVLLNNAILSEIGI